MRGDKIPKNIPKGIDWLQKAAIKGNPYAQEKIGECYAEGIGVPQDREEGNKWLLKTITNPGINSIIQLGFIYKLATRYESGKYVDKDLKKAFELYLQCTSETLPFSFPMAYNKIGEYYEKGIFVEKNYEMAVRYFKKAIEKGECTGLPEYKLSLFYSKGLGVEKNLIKARELLKLSSDQGCLEAKIALHPIVYPFINNLTIFLRIFKKNLSEPVLGHRRKGIS